MVLDVVDESFDVIILDINMPGMNGFETLERLNTLDLGIPVLFYTGAAESRSMDWVVQALNLGAYDYITKPLELEIFKVKIRRAIEKRMYVLQERRYKEALEDEVRLKTKELEEKNRLLLAYSTSLEQATIQMMSSLQNAMEAKDYYTAGHTTRVTDYAVLLGESLALSEDDLIVLRRAAQCHDIGKLAIDLSCIHKPGKLTDEEWVLIRKHPGDSANIIEPLGFMEREVFIVRHHHERMDGKGYPDGLAGDQLNQLTRIITVVDSFDAMTSRRDYRRNMNVKEAIDELYRCSGSQFDPNIVDCFAKAITSIIPEKSSVLTNGFHRRMFAGKAK